MRIVKALLCEAWECLQFWTPLTVVVIVLWLLYRPDHFRRLCRPHRPQPHKGTDDRRHGRTSSAEYPVRSCRQPQLPQLAQPSQHPYLDISATAFHNNGSTKLGPSVDAFPTPFRQGPKNTTMLRPVFHGTVAVDSMVAADLKRQLAAGKVQVTVRVSLTLMYKVVWPVSEIFFYKYDCWILFQSQRVAGTSCLAVKSSDK